MKVKPFIISDYLKTDEDMIQYFSAVLESGSADAIVGALGDIAKAKGMAKVAEITGLNEESLEGTFRPGAIPSFETIIRITQALNIKLHAFSQ